MKLIYLRALSASAESAKILLDVLKAHGDLDAEKKLQFDLSVAYLVAAAVHVCNERHWSKALQVEIMDGVCSLYVADLKEFSDQNLVRNGVDADIFIKEAGERELFRQYIGLKVDKLPKTDLYTLAACLFKKRFLEYQKLHIADVESLLNHQNELERIHLPQMPHRVYEHWSGNRSGAWESLQFATELHAHLSEFCLCLAKELSGVVVSTERDN